jgi:ribosomal subunit interface protein
MKIHVRGKQLEIDETARSHIERRLEFSLGRFSPRVLRVTVQLTDVNGPRGGDDKACRIEVRLRPTGTVLVQDRDAGLVAVVDRAADRIGRSVARALERERELERQTRPARSASSPVARSETENCPAE